MEILGRTTIHPALFYSGKIAGYLLWVLLALDLAGVHSVPGMRAPFFAGLSTVVAIIGLAFIISSFINLGSSVRLGLPSGDTTLKTGGVYRLSRNPMYVGFDAWTIAAVLRLGNPIVLLLGAYSIVVYHSIIHAEERFLDRAFGEPYRDYKAAVRRYV